MPLGGVPSLSRKRVYLRIFRYLLFLRYLFYVSDAAGWVASTADDNQYLEVDLKVIYNVTKVVLQGSGKAANAWTKQFKVL